MYEVDLQRTAYGVPAAPEPPRAPPQQQQPQQQQQQVCPPPLCPYGIVYRSVLGISQAAAARPPPVAAGA